MRYGLYAIAGIQVLSALLAVARIGQKREPITHGDAVVSILLVAVFVAVELVAAGRLS